MFIFAILSGIFSAIGCVLYYGLGMIAYLLGFTAAGIVKGSIAAFLMSLSWTSGLFMPVIAFLQSIGTAFGALAASCWL